MIKSSHTRRPDSTESNRCARCGRFVGDTFTGYTHDRMSARGPLFCDPCLKRRFEQEQEQRDGACHE